MMILETNSSGQTKKFAGFLVSVIANEARPRLQARLTEAPAKWAGRNFKNALVLALSGDLGSGKTTFVQGFLRGLGVRRKITSPTFVLIKNYKLQTKNYKRVYHIDCYRIKESKELLDLGLKEILNNPKNIVLIEWPERIKKILPKDLIWIKFQYGGKENERILKFQ